MKRTIHESLVELDEFLKAEKEAFDRSAKSAHAEKAEKYRYYAEGVAAGYHMTRAWIHCNILNSRVEPGDVLSVAILRKLREPAPPKLERAVCG